MGESRDRDLFRKVILHKYLGGVIGNLQDCGEPERITCMAEADAANRTSSSESSGRKESFPSSAPVVIVEWRSFYHRVHPHSRLGCQSPDDFADRKSVV